MKRLVSIVLTLVLLLNVFGYYGIFVGLQYKNERSITRALDSDLFAGFETIMFKVPMSVPYMPDQPIFERVTGNLEYHGELYRLVKQKYAKDTLTVVCIRDVEHKKIDRKLSDYAKALADITIASHSNEYLPLTIAIDSFSDGWTTTLSYYSIQEILFPTFSASINHPPELA